MYINPPTKLYITYSLIAFKCLKRTLKPPKKTQQHPKIACRFPGRHLLTAVLFPRMRVDNGLTLWNALAGTKAGSGDTVAFFGQAEQMQNVQETCRKTLKFDVCLKENFNTTI